MTSVVAVPIPKTLEKRLREHAERIGRPAAAIVKEALEKELDFDRWLARELDRAEKEADSGLLVPHEQVMRQARAVIRKHERASPYRRH